MNEEQEREAGAELARVLKLRRDTDHKDRWQTTHGTKTDLGLWRTIAGIVDEKRKEKLQ